MCLKTITIAIIVECFRAKLVKWEKHKVKWKRVNSGCKSEWKVFSQLLKSICLTIWTLPFRENACNESLTTMEIWIALCVKCHFVWKWHANYKSLIPSPLSTATATATCVCGHHSFSSSSITLHFTINEHKTNGKIESQKWTKLQMECDVLTLFKWIASYFLAFKTFYPLIQRDRLCRIHSLRVFLCSLHWQWHQRFSYEYDV